MLPRTTIRKILLLICFCIIVFQPYHGNCHAKKYPEIGKDIPDFVVEGVKDYKNSKISRTELIGQYYILDFWSSHCGVCIASFPKINMYQEKFKGKLQFFLVGFPDKIIDKLYARLRAEHNLKLANAYSADLMKEFVHGGVPFLVWVDKNGIIKAITGSKEVSDENIDKFLEDKSFDFEDHSFAGREAAPTFDDNKSFLIDGNGGRDTNYIFRSVLSRWDRSMPVHRPGDIEIVRDKFYSGKGYNVLKVDLGSLYKAAYFGYFRPKADSIYPHLILNLKDSSEFKVDTAKGRGYYCYSISMPRKFYNSKDLKRLLRNDLNNYFPYHANVERRMMPCYVLVVTDRIKNDLLRIGEGKKKDLNFVVTEFSSVKLQELAKVLSRDLPGNMRVFDETGITYEVSVKINALSTDVTQIKNELNRYGLDMVLTKRSMDVLVISD